EYDWTATNPISGNYEVTIVNDIRATDLGSPLFSFQLTAPNAVGVAHISLIENAFFNDNWEAISPDSMPTMTVTISVPEPMTLGLLGLGGLFLRRRK
ncbi:MAG: PEP-CTERM sorting domain-containing protein, partial [Sedimentisphaerales bacterium]